MYKKRDLESNVIEIINLEKGNIIDGCIYGHTNMDLNELNSDYLNSLLAKLSKQKKTVFLLGDYKVDLSKYEQRSPTNEFLDSLDSSMFLPSIIQPTRVISNSKIVIDIFSDIISTDIISGNLTAAISDHLSQFVIASEIFKNSPSNKSNYFERDWSNFNQENFTLDYFSVNWKNVIDSKTNDVNHSLQNFFDSVNDWLKIHAPYKKVIKYKLKFREKPWISSGIQKSISIKNSIFKKYINKKDPHIKEQLHQKYKNYRNIIATLMKKSKQNYFKKYFESKIKNLKSTWKGIKSIISLKNSASIF